MDALAILKNGHRAVEAAVEGLPEADWYTLGVAGVWSVKDIIAHLAGFEHLLVEALRALLNDGPTPALDRFVKDREAFNDAEVAARHAMTVGAVWVDYAQGGNEALAQLAQTPEAARRRKGALPCFGADCDLEDFIVDTIYGHKREHAAQIAAFRTQRKRPKNGIPLLSL